MSELSKLEKLINQSKFEEALALLNSTKMSRDFKVAIKGTIEFKQKNLESAEVHFLKALELNPKNPIANANYASLLISLKKHRLALKYAEAAYEVHKDKEQQALVYAACLAEADRHGDAVKVLSPLSKSDKPSKNLLVSLASVLRADLQGEEALRVLERARTLYPDEFDIERSLADVYAEVDQEQALHAFREVLLKQPDNLPIQWNSSFTELRLGHLERGWELYDAGLTDKIGKIGRPLPYQVRQIPMITAISELDQTKWTMFSCEQGLGDQILFLTAFREVLEQFPRSILVGEERMLTLMRRSFPEIGVYSYGFGYALGSQGYRFNGVFPIGSYMKAFRSHKSDFKKTTFPFINPNKDRAAKFRQKLLDRSGGREIIGISWSGGYWDRQKRTKSLDFETFLKLLPKNARYACLQYGDVAKEKKLATESNAPITFIEGVDFKKDIDGWVALIDACDRIISVSTAMVHFAAALGKRVDLLLTQHQAPFIWQLDEGPSLPYPSVMRHRVRPGESLDSFVDRMKETL